MEGFDNDIKFPDFAFDDFFSGQNSRGQNSRDNNFDVVELYKKHCNVLHQNLELYSLFCCLITIRGTNIEKIRRTTRNEGLESLDEINRTFNIDWTTKGRNLRPSTLTPGRMIMLMPVTAVLSMRHIRHIPGLNSDLPYPFRIKSVIALIPQNWITYIEAANFAAYNLTRVTSPNIPGKNAAEMAILKRNSTPEEWAQLKIGIQKTADRFAAVRVEFGLPAAPDGEIYDWDDVVHDIAQPSSA
ncbi:hypothetical protein HUG17_8680 [Dermatophagoides farinae]|uniref:Uncharacterized protein n=1 Tax=Dermatophagoides farinae TaxID=6954 RepID=A0A9D4NST3_DERFA|nr:hypothetical protein HUG17_8680 [Dermatophagoides farinae]